MVPLFIMQLSVRGSAAHSRAPVPLAECHLDGSCHAMLQRSVVGQNIVVDASGSVRRDWKAPGKEVYEMDPAPIYAGHRCKGDPTSVDGRTGWGNLGKRGLTTEQCKAACLIQNECKYAVFRKFNNGKGSCSSFDYCEETTAAPNAVVWVKIKAEVQGVFAEIKEMYQSARTGPARFYRGDDNHARCGFSLNGKLGPSWAGTAGRVAVNEHDYFSGTVCGMCVEVNVANKVKLDTSDKIFLVDDVCHDCGAGELAFRNTVYKDNLAAAEWRAVPCPVSSSKVEFLIIEGSNQWFLRIQPRNTRYPVSKFELYHRGLQRWVEGLLDTHDYYFVFNGDRTYDFPMKVRLTAAVTAEQIEDWVYALKDNVVLQGDVQFTVDGVQSEDESVTDNPNPLIMKLKKFRETGLRCRGRPALINGKRAWGNLGKNVDPKECIKACLQSSDCNFALYKNNKCSAFSDCTETQPQPGFTVWEKTYATTPAEDSRKLAEDAFGPGKDPPSLSAPMISLPNPACACDEDGDVHDISTGHEGCKLTDGKHAWCFIGGGEECSGLSEVFRSDKFPKLFWKHCVPEIGPGSFQDLWDIDHSAVFVQKSLRSYEEWSRKLARDGVRVSLTQKHFDKGTYRINVPGVYTLKEDVQFNPLPEQNWFPAPDSREHPMSSGYFLGFFAAISIEVTGVVLDLDNHKIQQHPEHYYAQRFFSVIELADRPFVAAKGPPQFSALKHRIHPAKHVVIENGVLGLSSHHGIHGNKCSRITLRNLVIRDFEVGGVSLNGASEVFMENIHIGPSSSSSQLKVPLPTLSQARFLHHIFADLIANLHKPLASLSKEVKVKLAGQSVSVSSVMDRLGSAIHAFLADAVGKTADAGALKDAYAVFRNAHGLPDGSAVYGVLLHKAAPAVHEFGACEVAEREGLEAVPLGLRYLLKNVTVQGLRLVTDEVIQFNAPMGRKVVGPAGDVIQLLHASTCAKTSPPKLQCSWPLGDVKYVGNVLSDAQFALQTLEEAAEKSMKLTKEEAFMYFGSMHIPQIVRNWAAGTVDSLQQIFEEGKFSLTCSGDSMAHFNKGAVGIRLEFVEGAFLQDVYVRDLENHGSKASDICAAANANGVPYLGADARGIVVSVSRNVGGARVEVEGIRALSGKAFGVDLRHATERIGLSVKVNNVQGLPGSAAVSGSQGSSVPDTYQILKTER